MSKSKLDILQTNLIKISRYKDLLLVKAAQQEQLKIERGGLSYEEYVARHKEETARYMAHFRAKEDSKWHNRLSAWWNKVYVG